MRQTSVLISASLVLAFASALATTSRAQGTRADYERAAALLGRTAGKVTNTISQFQWSGDDRLWYALQLGDGRVRYLEVNGVSGEKRPLFDHANAAEMLARVLGRPVQPDQLPIDRLHVTAAQIDALLGNSASVVRLDRDSGAWTEIEAQALERDRHPFVLSGARGRTRGASSAIIVDNQTDGPLSLFWLSDGNSVPYGVVSPRAVRRQHTFGGHRWRMTRPDGTIAFEGPAADLPGIVVIRQDALSQPPEDPAPQSPTEASPAGAPEKPRARIQEGNVVLVSGDSEQVLARAEDRRLGEFSGPINWSPDRTRFVARFRMRGATREVHVVESSPADQVQPRLHSFEYLKPGDAMDVAAPRLFDAERGVEIPLETSLFSQPRMIEQLAWLADSTQFSFVYTQRGHSVSRLVGVSRDGQTSTIVEESFPTFVDVTNSQYLHRIPKSGEALWMSERDGWRHLYLIDETPGRPTAIRNPITSGPWVVRSVDHVDVENRQVWFRAGGIHPGQDPYHLHAARVNFDGTGLTILTEGDGTHEVEFSPDRRLLLDRYSRVDMPEVAELRRADTGAIVARLEQADWSSLRALPWVPPQPFAAKGRDGVTDIYGVIVRPSGFDPGTRYPVIENIYAGPHGAFVPKAFVAHMGVMHDLAELGFIVVQIDGMGTAHRSKAFHDVCWKNLADGGFPDRIAWLRAAAARHPEMDLSRVGIFGGSAGGQNALAAVLHHGDFYKAAVADCGCHDNRVDKLWWNEAWMGWPVDESYASSSNVTHAHKLRGNLLLIVGELDRNVDPASTMQVVNALVKADKDFDLLVLPGMGHGAAESPYGRRRRADFFVRHLLNVAPRRE